MQPQQYIERKNAQNYHKTTYPVCINCQHCQTRRAQLPIQAPHKSPVSAYLMPKCIIGEFHVTANGCCDRFEYSDKSARRVERREKFQAMD
jgi:hypothetical protein